MKAPNVSRRISTRLIKEANEAVKNEEWDRAYLLCTAAVIWLEAAMENDN